MLWDFRFSYTCECGEVKMDSYRGFVDSGEKKGKPTFNGDSSVCWQEFLYTDIMTLAQYLIWSYKQEIIGM